MRDHQAAVFETIKIGLVLVPGLLKTSRRYRPTVLACLAR